jgi:hypothetical protein
MVDPGRGSRGSRRGRRRNRTRASSRVLVGERQDVLVGRHEGPGSSNGYFEGLGPHGYHWYSTAPGASVGVESRPTRAQLCGVSRQHLHGGSARFVRHSGADDAHSALLRWRPPRRSLAKRFRRCGGRSAGSNGFPREPPAEPQACAGDTEGVLSVSFSRGRGRGTNPATPSSPTVHGMRCGMRSSSSRALVAGRLGGPWRATRTRGVRHPRGRCCPTARTRSRRFAWNHGASEGTPP